MPASPNGEDERDSQVRRRAIIGEVDALLRRGADPDAAELAARFAEEADRIRSLIEIRKSLFQEGVIEDVEDAPAEEPQPLLTPHAESGDRDRALADIKREFQDAMNRGDAPDAIGIVDERPDLKDEVAELSNYYSFMADALKPEFVGPAPEPVQEVVLSHFRLVTMHARHPLGGLFLGVDHHTNQHVELLVIRGQMSKVRSKRMLREALSIRDLGDPAFVPVVDAGEVNDIRFVAWEYPSELSVARVVKRLRRGGGHRFLRDVLDEHSDSGHVSKDPRPPAEEIPIDVPPDAASRLLADRVHVANVLELVAMVAEALDRAHLRGFVFGDLRPDNVFVNHAGQARLRGFGLVHHARAAWHRLGDDSVYLAPEVLADAEPPLDWRADVWGVGLIAYALLALKDPPDFSTVGSRAERLFVDLRGSPEALVPLLDQALERDPAARPASCAIMAEELRKMAAALKPVRGARAGAPPVPPAVWYAFLTLVLVAVVTWVLWAVL